MATVTKIPERGQPQAGTIHWLNECVERSKLGVFSETTIMTPGLAAELLRRNPDNRGIRLVKSAQYAADIRAGKWAFNGEPIIVSDDGLLNDGQHRCSAVVTANVPIQVLMVFGVPRETRTTVDQGAARTASDYLSMDGVPNAAICAAIARIALAYERNNGTSLTSISMLSNAEVMQRVYADASIAASAKFAATNCKSTRAFAAPAIIGFCHYLFSDISTDEAETYMVQVCRGEGLHAKDPAYRVRERLMSLGTQSRENRIHLIIRGWNAFRQGRKLELVKIAGSDNLPAVI